MAVKACRARFLASRLRLGSVLSEGLGRLDFRFLAMSISFSTSLGIAHGVPQHAPKLNDANDLREFSGGSSKLIFDFLALNRLAARILWHRFLGSYRVPPTSSR